MTNVTTPITAMTYTVATTDVDQCASAPCQHDGTCIDGINGFTCSCLHGLYTGSTCETVVRHSYYPYGPGQGDTNIADSVGYSCDWCRKGCSSQFIRIPNVQIFNGQYRRLKIYTNGYVTFGLDFDGRYPDRLNKNLLAHTKRKNARARGFAMLAPLWTDNDARHGDVYYHIYDLTQPGSTSLEQARVMPNTFQLVIAYDPSRYQTFVMYIYKDMGWDNKFTLRRSMIGHFSYKYDEKKSLQLALSMTQMAFRLNKRIGNTGERGRYLFRVTSGRHVVNYDQKCSNWFANEMKRIWLVRYYWSWTMVCPCDLRLALMDTRWGFDWKQFYETEFERRCIYERMPWKQSTQECCYTPYGALIGTEDGRGGQTFFYHPRYRRLHEKYDVLPKEWCCLFTDNCERFYHVRPIDYCWGYTPLFIGWFYGDPHIRTLDGFQYTFNGLGEYILIETTHGNFTLQGRTEKARDDNGTKTDATVFSAFAARDVDSDTVHVGMTPTGDEFTLSIGVNARQLDVTVGAPEKFKNNTKGLMGVFNGDPTDDLLPPGENAAPLSNTSSEKTIFKEFGETWRIQKIDSLFYYALGESYSTFARTEFKPLFLEDVLVGMTAEERRNAEKTCGENKECLFDFVVTGNGDAAAATLETNSKNEDDLVTLSNASPMITVSNVFNVTVGQDNALTVSTSDPDGDTVNIKLVENAPVGASFTGGVFKWNPVNMEPINISFSASDGNGGIAAAVVKVNLCNCSGRGQCLFELLADGYELKQTFRIVQCNCSIGWEGDNCESDMDGCQDNPCTAGTICTDVSPAEQVASGKSHICSECPAGTEDNGGICLHIDECVEGTSGCEQVCENTIGSYVCSCVDGYKLNVNNETCLIDIDECSMNNGRCDHVCSNYDGGFNCSCNIGFQLMSDKKGCKTCPRGMWGQDCLRDCECRDIDTECNVTTGCAECPDGFQGGDCREDIDECTVNNPCDEHANCNNTIGTFKCVCHAGYTQYNATVCEDLDECESDPCENGGDCHNGNNAFSCRCMPGYTGTNCETEIEICDSNPCQNGATCSQNGGKYACQCTPGYTGLDCDQDFDECASSPCMNGGTCKDQLGGFTCSCADGYSGPTCNTEIDVSDIARVSLDVKLENKKFTADLTDKSTAAYQLLKTKVAGALNVILDDKLGAGNYKILDITFSKGSVVVNYLLEMMKDAADSTEINVRNAISKKGGVFAEYSVDVDFVKSSVKKIVGYHGQFRVPELDFNEKWGNINTPEYDILATEVGTELDKVYNLETGSHLVYVADIRFTKGSVIVDFTLYTDDVTNRDLLNAVFSVNTFTVGGKAIDPNSFDFSGKTRVFIVVSSTISLVLLVIALTVAGITVSKRIRNRRRSSQESDDDSSFIATFPERQNLGMKRSSLQPVDPAIDLQREHSSLDVFTRATQGWDDIRWVMTRRFTSRYPQRQDEVMPREPSVFSVFSRREHHRDKNCISGILYNSHTQPRQCSWELNQRQQQTRIRSNNYVSGDDDTCPPVMLPCSLDRHHDNTCPLLWLPSSRDFTCRVPYT
ncbi:hypothetical protein NP493_2378g00005 [Ridgeia piscesae]|uniref:Mucin-like protein n=1 Tax=Ridgeia piscesae TaxID=27915 RepID=A0AAD9N2F3_RIDPI|nr:hypothetical protein NP493_2378g00005 [Ridgeia piscesae]